jgi:hypothetical protein
VSQKKPGENLKQRRQGSTPKKAAFLEAYAATCSITRAAGAAEINRTTHYVWLDSDSEYKAEFEAAREKAIEALEDEAVRRAREGVERPVYQGGKKVGVVQEYSDTLLIFLLKGARPQKYRDNVHVEGRAEISLVEILRRREAKQLPASAAETTVDLEILPDDKRRS